MATGKPILVNKGKTIDCTGVIVQDNTILEGRELPSFIVLQLSLFGESIFSTIKIDNTSTLSLTNFLADSTVLINSSTLGKTLIDDKLIELSCGIIQINYHWFNQTNIAISYIKGKKEVTGTSLPIPDSIYLLGTLYTVNRSKSTTLKLIINEELQDTGSSQLIKGQFDSYYFINDCEIIRGQMKELGSLPVLDCESKDCDIDENIVDESLRSLMILKAAYIKLGCKDVVNANQLIKKLCSRYANDCYKANSLVSDCKEKDYSIYTSPCSNCS